MHLYRTYVEKEDGEIKNVFFVKEGFVFPAFLFTIIYTLCFGLWRASALLLFAFVVIVAISINIDKELAFALMIGLAFYTGLNFADWRIKKIEQNEDVKFNGYVIGRSREDARFRFFNELSKKD